MAINDRTLQLQQQMRDQLDKITDQQTRDLTSAWVDAWDEIAPDLAAALLLALDPDPAVSKANLARSARLTQALAQVLDALQQLTAAAGVSLPADLQEVTTSAAATQAGIIASQLPPEQTLVDATQAVAPITVAALSQIVERSTQQITSRLRPIAAGAHDLIRRELIRGVAAGSNPKVTAARMLKRAEKRFNLPLSQALTIARTESLDAHRDAAAVAQRAHADVLAGWTWLAKLDSRTCPSCIAQNGQLHSLDEPGPLDHPNGRCARMPTVKPWSELGFDIDEPKSVVPDAQAWFDALPEAEKLRILGPSRLDAYKAGDFPMDFWSQRRENPDWRPSYQMAPVPPGYARGTGSRGGSGGGRKPPTTTTREPDDLPDLKPWDAKNGALPDISNDDLTKVLDGVQRGRKIVGGHRAGLGIDGKTEYPNREPWIETEQLRQQISDVMSSAHWRKSSGDRWIARRYQDGIVHEVQWYYPDGPESTPIFRSAFPLGGEGVVRNIDGSSEPRDLDLEALYELGDGVE